MTKYFGFRTHNSCWPLLVLNQVLLLETVKLMYFTAPFLLLQSSCTSYIVLFWTIIWHTCTVANKHCFMLSCSSVVSPLVYFFLCCSHFIHLSLSLLVVFLPVTFFFSLENTALTFSVSLSTMSLIVEREVVKHDIWDYDTQTGRRKHRQRHSRLFHYWPNLLGSVFLADKALVWEHWVP